MAGTHKMGASYSGLYEEGEVEHINVPPVPSHFFFFFSWDRVWTTEVTLREGNLRHNSF